MDGKKVFLRELNIPTQLFRQGIIALILGTFLAFILITLHPRDTYTSDIPYKNLKLAASKTPPLLLEIKGQNKPDVLCIRLEQFLMAQSQQNYTEIDHWDGSGSLQKPRPRLSLKST